MATTLTATTGDDSWTMSKGVKLTTFDGLDGTDTFSFGKVKLTQVTINEGSADAVKVDTVSGASATYHLQLDNIEMLKFDNGKSIIDLSTYFTVATGATTSGNDTLKGTSDGDTLLGDTGNDTLYGLGGNDSQTGGSGNDTLYGGNGDDRIDGGAGRDKLTGGDDADIFVFSALKSGDYATITDFTDSDFLEFDTTVFTSLVGATEENLISGKKALEADDFLLYSAGKLYYDADGSGNGAAIQIAGIKGTDAKTLTIDDFHFV